ERFAYQPGQQARRDHDQTRQDKHGPGPTRCGWLVARSAGAADAILAEGDVSGWRTGFVVVPPAVGADRTDNDRFREVEAALASAVRFPRCGSAEGACLFHAVS